MTMTLIETITVGSGGASSIEFTSIPQDGKDLKVLFSNRFDTGQATIQVQLNSDTGANYSKTALNTFGPSYVQSAQVIVGTSIAYVGGGRQNFTSNTFASNEITISNYASSSSKSLSVDAVVENNSGADFKYYLSLTAGNYTTTDAVTSIKLFGSGANFVEHSTASLYKVVTE